MPAISLKEMFDVIIPHGADTFNPRKLVISNDSVVLIIDDPNDAEESLHVNLAISPSKVKSQAALAAMNIAYEDTRNGQSLA